MDELYGENELGGECTELVFSTHNIFKLPTKPVLLVKIFVIELST